MRLGKIVKLIFLLPFFLFFFKRMVFANENSFVTIVNPVRGDEFFDVKPADVLSGVRLEKEWVDQEKLKATWLLRFDVLDSKEMLWYFQNNFEDQELGIFMEITPNQAQKAKISYPQGGLFWHDANKIFLSGYRPEERIKLIDKVFQKFKEIFGYYPKSVGAWHIDAYSAGYMRQKYGVTGVLICADQFGTDGYQIWGGWWGVPYYPSKYNILMPAQTLKNKLDIVVFQWAARDPSEGYGGSVEESTYSVQVNDYLRHGLGVNYFQKVSDIYLGNQANQFSQLTVGLENDNDWEKIGESFALQLEEVKRRVLSSELKVLTMADFSNWYRQNFIISPPHQIGEWLMSPSFRVGLVEKDNQTIVKDLRIYNEKWPEANLLTANPWETLSLNNPYKVDTVRFPDKQVPVPSEVSSKNLIKNFGRQVIPFEINFNYFLLFYCSIVLLLGYLLRKNLKLFLLILIGSISLSLTMVRSGIIYPFGMGFWGPNGHDGIWHLALINQLAKFSLANPVFSGAKMTNYHFGFDLLAAILSRLTRLNPVSLYFQILPPLMALLIGVLTYKFVEKWLGSKRTAWWSVFFVYFGGSWGWLVSFVRNKTFSGESMFWANQAISTLINPPYAFSLVIILGGLIKFLEYLKNPNWRNLFICSLFFGILIQVKVYAGIIILGSLLLLGVLSSIIQTIEPRNYWRLFFGSILFALVIFLPFNLKSASLVVFSPFWFPHTMLAFQDRLNWIRLENARQAYLATYQWFKWFLAEDLALLIFVFGNLGARFIGFFWFKNLLSKRRASAVEILLVSCLFFSFILSLIFIQKGNPWNTIQFFYYFQFFMAIFAGGVVGSLWQKTPKTVKYVTLLLITALTLPTTFSTLRNDYLPSRPPARISVEELEALEFLKKQPEGVILTYPFNKEWIAKFSEPRPLYAYETTAYVSALSGKQTFLEDEMNLEISGYDWRSRRKEEDKFFSTNDSRWANDFIKINNIKYVYLVKGQKMNLGLGDINGEKIFENGEVSIFKVNEVK